MDKTSEKITAAALKSQEQSTRLFEQLMKVAQPESVFSEPMTSGELTVITASEVATGLGFGFGIGAGEGMVPESSEEGEKPDEMREGSGSGGGGGGGGGSMARPVAVISISPQGVEIKPVVDVTKLGLALFVTAGSMFMLLSRMWRMSR